MSQAAQQGGVYDYAELSLYEPQAQPQGPSSSSVLGSPACSAAGGAVCGDGDGGNAAVAAGGEAAAGRQGAGGAPVGRVVVRQRVGAFLQPQDPRYFQAGGSAVAVYQYRYVLTRAAQC